MWVCKLVITADASLLESGKVQEELASVPQLGVLSCSGDKVHVLMEDASQTTCENRIRRLQQLPGINRIDTLFAKESQQSMLESREQKSFGEKISQSIWNGILRQDNT